MIGVPIVLYIFKLTFAFLQSDRGSHSSIYLDLHQHLHWPPQTQGGIKFCHCRQWPWICSSATTQAAILWLWGDRGCYLVTSRLYLKSSEMNPLTPQGSCTSPAWQNLPGGFCSEVGLHDVDCPPPLILLIPQLSVSGCSHNYMSKSVCTVTEYQTAIASELQWFVGLPNKGGREVGIGCIWGFTSVPKKTDFSIYPRITRFSNRSEALVIFQVASLTLNTQNMDYCPVFSPYSNGDCTITANADQYTEIFAEEVCDP